MVFRKLESRITDFAGRPISSAVWGVKELPGIRILQDISLAKILGDTPVQQNQRPNQWRIIRGEEMLQEMSYFDHADKPLDAMEPLFHPAYHVWTYLKDQRFQTRQEALQAIQAAYSIQKIESKNAVLKKHM